MAHRARAELRAGMGRVGVIAEPDVALTDYGLAIECAILAGLARRQAGGASFWLCLFFMALAVAAVTGGSVHAFFPDPQQPGQRVLWLITMLSIGLAACSAVALGARLVWSPPVARRVTVAAFVPLIVYAAALVGRQDFVLAMLVYLPATLFLLGVFAWRWHRERAGPALVAVAGLGLTLLAALVQRLEIQLEPAGLSHNALYHAIQAVGLLLVYLGAAPLARASRG